MGKIAVNFLVCLGCLALGIAEADALSLTSPAFSDGGMMPFNSGYRNGNVSPVLEWSDVPGNAEFFALVMDDPDARGWTHWVVFNIPGSVTALGERFPKEGELPDGTRQGKNDFGKLGYGGPSPPSGTHRYLFRLFALDSKIDLEPGISKALLLKAMEGHIIGEAKLVGKYSK